MDAAPTPYLGALLTLLETAAALAVAAVLFCGQLIALALRLDTRQTRRAELAEQRQLAQLRKTEQDLLRRIERLEQITLAAPRPRDSRFVDG